MKSYESHSQASVIGVAPDYTLCEREVLDKTASFQSNGAVLVLDAHSYAVIGMSQNWVSVSGIHTEGQWPYVEFLLSDLLAVPDELSHVEDQIKLLKPTATLVRQRKPFELQAVRSGDFIFVEWIPTGHFQLPTDRNFQTPRPTPASVKASRLNLYQTLQDFCVHLQEAMGLDRVMIYQFDAQQAGDVVAESCRSDWTPYLGLHYPATDIPAVARQLYLKVPSRQVYDAMCPPVALLTLAEHPASSLDLTACSLRSVSPYHLEYLQNMGVRSSLSIAIVYQGELWGLLSCHHGQPLSFPMAMRQYVLETVGLLQACLTDWYHYQEELDAGYVQRMYQAQVQQIQLLDPQEHVEILESLLLGNYGLESVLHAHAAAIYADGVIAATGNIPDEAWLHDFVKAWRECPNAEHPDLFVSNHLSEDSPIPADFSPETSGMMALRVSASPEIILFSFRQESLHEVHWGGNPYVIQEPGKPLSPRRSFQLWKETVLNHARSWSDLDVACIKGFAQFLTDQFSPELLKSILKEGTRTLAQQIRQHTYIARALINGVQSGIAMAILESTDTPSTLLHMNQSLQSIFAMPMADAVTENRSVDEVLSHLGLTQAQIQTLSGIPQRMNVWSPRLGHRVVKMTRRNLLSLYDTQTRYAIVAFQFFDITAEERIESSLRAAHRQVDQADAAKLKFLTHTSNELLSPLKRVLALSEGLHEELETMALDDLALYTEQMSHAHKHMLNRVEQLLFFARSASGHVLLDLEKVDLYALLNESMQWLHDFSRKQEVNIRLDPVTDPLWVSGNKQALQHMLVNLLDNAVRYSQSGATVHCRLRLDAHGERVFVDIEDQGKGMSEHELAQVFTPFYSGEQPYRSGQHQEGSGLGLTLVKHIVEAHRGHLDLQSAVNRGTQVSIALPQRQSQERLELSMPYYGS